MGPMCSACRTTAAQTAPPPAAQTPSAADAGLIAVEDKPQAVPPAALPAALAKPNFVFQG
eukprot:scaffold8328_cov26-Tisochrysis_lutea.AAC.4